MMKRKPIPYGRQHITDEDIQAVVQVLKSDYLTQGPTIAAFEGAFAKYIGCKYAVAVANGTAALHLCTLALNVQKGEKVITSPITFAASANCVRYCGGEVVFADIDTDTYLLDIENVRALLEAAPKGIYKGIIPVDFAGRAVDLEEFRKLADEYGLWMIEDACHGREHIHINRWMNALKSQVTPVVEGFRHQYWSFNRSLHDLVNHEAGNVYGLVSSVVKFIESTTLLNEYKSNALSFTSQFGDSSVVYKKLVNFIETSI